jgi:uncharacterized OsmC-like protein
MLHINTSKLSGTTLSGRARGHVVLTDRRAEGDEQERGCTSGELMMLAVGSCVIGNLNILALEQGIDIEDLSAEVRVEDVPEDGFGAITVDVQIGGEIPEGTLEDLREAAGSGRVTSRFRQNSEVRIAVNQLPHKPSGETRKAAEPAPATPRGEK